MTKVATAPAAAPWRRRVRESPRRIAGISMLFSFRPTCLGANATDARGGSGRCRQVGLKGRPLCAGVSVAITMRLLHGQVDSRREDIYPGTRLVLRPFGPILMKYLENVFRSFHEGIDRM